MVQSCQLANKLGKNIIDTVSTKVRVDALVSSAESRLQRREKENWQSDSISLLLPLEGSYNMLPISYQLGRIAVFWG